MGAVETFGLVAGGQSDDEHHRVRTPGGAAGLGEQLGVRLAGDGVVTGRVDELGRVPDPGLRRLERGVELRRVDQRAARTLVARGLGEGADHGDRPVRRQRQQPVVRQQDRPGRCGPAGQRMVGVVVDGRVPGVGGLPRDGPQRQLDHASAGEVEIGLRQGARVQGGRDPRVPGPRTAGHLEVQPGVDADRSVGHGEPVTHDQAVEAPLGAQDVGEELARFAGVLAVDEVVGAHHGPGVRLGDREFEARQVELAQRPLVDDGVEAHPVALLVVHREVLHTRADPLGLHAPHQSRRRLARKDRILREVLEVPAPGRVPLDVQTRPEQDGDVLAPRLASEGGPDLLEKGDVPGRPQRHGRRETRRRH